MDFQKIKIASFGINNYILLDENYKVIYASILRQIEMGEDEYNRIINKQCTEYVAIDVFHFLKTSSNKYNKEKLHILNALKSLGIDENNYPEYFI